MNITKIKLVFASIGILITISFMLAATYAYFTIQDPNEEINMLLKEFNEVIEVKYSDTSNVSLVGAYPGDSLIKTFTVKNIGGKPVYYNILLDDLVNNFSNPDDLIFTLNGTPDGTIVSQTIMPNTYDSLIASNVLIKSGTTHSYIMTITFLKTTEDQTNNMNKTFSSNISVLPANKNFNNIYESGTLVHKILSDNSILSENELNFKMISDISGLYYTNNSIDGSTVYFFKGESDSLNNNVLFGNFCWKIIRTTEDLGVRLIYNGISENGICSDYTNTNAFISNTSFNTLSSYNAYVGFMYGAANSAAYKNEHLNTNTSTVKTTLDSWYASNLGTYSSYIKDSYYCNNRKMTKFKIGNVNYGTNGYGNANTGYYSMKKLSLDMTRPSYNCSNKADIFTVSDKRGNTSLTNPIGLITADELVFAGLTINDTNTKNYLYNSGTYWTMTPAYFNGTVAYNYVSSAGKIQPKPVSISYGIRPVVTLKQDVNVASGNGSLNTPYRIAK